MPSTAPSLEETHKVHSYEVDVKRRLALPVLCQLMQEAAWNHAEQLGWGYSHLLERGLMWVLARQFIHMDAYPKWGDAITLRTWPSGRDRFFCYRDFHVLDAAARVIGGASSAWVVVDVAKRKPARTESFIQIDDVGPLFADRLIKLHKVTAGERVELGRVGYRDLDMNAHMNNVRYVEWILESFPLEFHEQHQLAELSIGYLAEARHGEEIVAEHEAAGDLAFRHCVRRAEGEELCRAETRWEAFAGEE